MVYECVCSTYTHRSPKLNKMVYVHVYITYTHRAPELRAWEAIVFYDPTTKVIVLGISFRFVPIKCHTDPQLKYVRSFIFTPGFKWPKWCVAI